MSLEVTLQNAISGLQTSKVAMQTISNNIANVNTTEAKGGREIRTAGVKATGKH